MENLAREIILRAKKDVFGSSIGDFVAPFKGDGLDFAEINDYHLGDDVKKINWKASAKSNSLKVNVFNEARELNIILIFMISGSINFGSVKLKQDVIAEILAILAYSSLKNKNRLWTLFFDNKELELFLPTKSEAIVYEIIKSTLNINVIGKKADFKNLCDYINTKFKQKSLIFLISDFYEKIDLSQIAHKNEVYALMIRDRLEEYPLLDGEFELVDGTNLRSNEFVLNKQVAKKYQKLLFKHDEKLIEHFLKHGINYGKIYTDDDLFLKLSSILKAK